MAQISARVSDELIRDVDRAARLLGWTRADLVRAALERFLEQIDPPTRDLETIRGPTDPVLEWADVRRELLSRE